MNVEKTRRWSQTTAPLQPGAHIIFYTCILHTPYTRRRHYFSQLRSVENEGWLDACTSTPYIYSDIHRDELMVGWGVLLISKIRKDFPPSGKRQKNDPHGNEKRISIRIACLSVLCTYAMKKRKNTRLILVQINHTNIISENVKNPNQIKWRSVLLRSFVRTSCIVYGWIGMNANFRIKIFNEQHWRAYSPSSSVTRMFACSPAPTNILIKSLVAATLLLLHHQREKKWRNDDNTASMTLQTLYGTSRFANHILTHVYDWMQSRTGRER